MGLLDRFRKKLSKAADSEPVSDPGLYLMDRLKKRLLEQNYEVESNTHELTLSVNNALLIKATIIDAPELHPMLIAVHILTLHRQLFPDGIAENIVGMGEHLEDKVESALTNYFTTTFPPIIDSLSDSHFVELDYTDNDGILWHPKPGDMVLQGQWEHSDMVRPLFDLLKEKLKGIKFESKINWLKMYMARQADGSLSGECLLNNEPWDDGFQEMCQQVQWEQPGKFSGQKQFVMIRRCDVFDAISPV